MLSVLFWAGCAIICASVSVVSWFARVGSPFDWYGDGFRRGVAALFAPLGAVAFFCGTLSAFSRVLAGEDVGPPPIGWLGFLVEALLVAASVFGALGALDVLLARETDPAIRRYAAWARRRLAATPT